MWKQNNNEKPINLEDLSLEHFYAGWTAFNASNRERRSGTVVSRHLPEIADRHLRISDVLDSMLDVYEQTDGS